MIIPTIDVQQGGVTYRVSAAGWAELVENNLNWPPMPSLLHRQLKTGHWVNNSGFPVRRAIYEALELAY